MSARSSRGMAVMSFVMVAAIGLALSYLFDRDHGERRRASLRQRWDSLWHADAIETSEPAFIAPPAQVNVPPFREMPTASQLPEQLSGERQGEASVYEEVLVIDHQSLLPTTLPSSEKANTDEPVSEPERTEPVTTSTNSAPRKRSPRPRTSPTNATTPTRKDSASGSTNTNVNKSTGSRRKKSDNGKPSDQG